MSFKSKYWISELTYSGWDIDPEVVFLSRVAYTSKFTENPVLFTVFIHHSVISLS